MKLKSIEIIGMHNVVHTKYNLHGFNYFYGKNGAGKSTVLQAIQLALLGYIPGTDKNKSSIFQHSNGNELTVILTLDDNACIKRSWIKKGREILATTEITPSGYDFYSLSSKIALPIFDFNEFIGMSANKLKDWFINFLPDSDMEVAWDAELSAAITDFGTILDENILADTIDYAINNSHTGVEQIRDVNAYLKQQQSYYKGELARVQSTIQSLIYHSDCDMTVDLDELQKKQSVLISSLGVLNASISSIQHNEKIKVRMQQFINVIGDDSHIVSENTRYKECKEQMASIESDIESMSQNISDLQAQHAKELDNIQKMQRIINSKGVCNYTKKKCDSMASQIPILTSEIESISKRIIEIEIEINNQQDDLNQLQIKLMDLTSKCNEIEIACVQIQSLMEQLDPCASVTSVDDITVEIHTLSDEIASIQDQITKIKANQKYDELTESLTKEKFRLEQNVEIMKEWIKLTDVNGLQQKVMVRPFAKFSEFSSEYLKKFFNNDIMSVEFNLAEKANSFSFGINNGRSYIQYDLLSSGEKCLLMLAILLGIVAMSSNQLHLIMVDDLLDHLDGARIEDCFDTLYTINDVQIILAGVQKCTHPKSADFVTTIR